MKRAVFGRCEEILRFPAEKSRDYVGLGGTILTIAALMRGLTAYDPVKACEMRICHTALDELVEWLYDLGDAGRSVQPLLVESERVDTLLPGALILVFVMAHTGAGEIAVSERDGMEGYLLQKLGS
jgi:exopolyphosphatase/pppGpp-phosphohydrolase